AALQGRGERGRNIGCDAVKAALRRCLPAPWGCSPAVTERRSTDPACRADGTASTVGSPMLYGARGRHSRKVWLHASAGFDGLGPSHARDREAAEVRRSMGEETTNRDYQTRINRVPRES